jgi:hypothetical protein
MRILAFLIGVVLLLPGACAFGFMLAGITALPPLGSAQWRDGDVWGIIGVATLGWGFCYVISFGGILLIRNALKREKPPAPDAGGSPPAAL